MTLRQIFPFSPNMFIAIKIERTCTRDGIRELAVFAAVLTFFDEAFEFGDIMEEDGRSGFSELKAVTHAQWSEHRAH